MTPGRLSQTGHLDSGELIKRLLRNFAKHGVYRFKNFGDLVLIDDRWWRNGQNIAGVAYQQTFVEAFAEGFIRARACSRLQLYASHQTQVAHVDDVRRVLKALSRVLKVG